MRGTATLTDDLVAPASGAGEWGEPADRFLAATAQVLGLTLVTAAARLLASTEYAAMANS